MGLYCHLSAVYEVVLAYVFNSQLCKSFITEYILSSSTRISALSKYLIVLSKSCEPKDAGAKVDTTKPSDENEGLSNAVGGKAQQPPTPAFRRLHLLYIVHDVLIHVRNHVSNDPRLAQRPQTSATLEQLYPVASTLAELAACGSGNNATSLSAPVLDVLMFWKQSQIFRANQVDEVRLKVSAAESAEWDSLLSKVHANSSNENGQSTRNEADEVNWRLPDRHGVVYDPSAPWHELPAANGLYMKRTRGYPLRAMAFEQGGFRIQSGGWSYLSQTRFILLTPCQVKKPTHNLRLTSNIFIMKCCALTTNTQLATTFRISMLLAISSGRIQTGRLEIAGDLR